MATYQELRSLFNNADLKNRSTTATLIAAQAEFDAIPGTVEGRSWALKVMRAPEQWGIIAFKSVLAANATATVAQITGASDASILANVNDVKAALIAAEAGQ